MTSTWRTRAGYALVLAVVSAAVIVFLLGSGGESDDTSDPPKGQAQVNCDRVARGDRTPSDFVATLKPGDIACFREGTHATSGDIKITAPNVTLTSFPGESATVRGRLWIARGANGVTVENLTLDGQSEGGNPSPTVNANRVVFRGNDVTNHHTSICFVLGDDIYGRADQVVIEDNRIHNCGELPATNQHHGIYVALAKGTVIRDNWIYSNADRGIQLYPDADGSVITGNVIDGNGQGVLFAGDEDDASDHNLVENNVITNSTIRWNIEGHWLGRVGSRNVARGNCVFGGARDPDNGGIEAGDEGVTVIDNVIADPLYIDRGSGDFRLKADSPCDDL